MDLIERFHDHRVRQPSKTPSPSGASPSKSNQSMAVDTMRSDWSFGTVAGGTLRIGKDGKIELAGSDYDQSVEWGEQEDDDLSMGADAGSALSERISTFRRVVSFSSSTLVLPGR